MSCPYTPDALSSILFAGSRSGDLSLLLSILCCFPCHAVTVRRQSLLSHDLWAFYAVFVVQYYTFLRNKRNKPAKFAGMVGTSANPLRSPAAQTKHLSQPQANSAKRGQSRVVFDDARNKETKSKPVRMMWYPMDHGDIDVISYGLWRYLQLYLRVTLVTINTNQLDLLLFHVMA